jgi:hypothetical protein
MSNRANSFTTEYLYCPKYSGIPFIGYQRERICAVVKEICYDD